MVGLTKTEVTLAILGVATIATTTVNAECPNACSGHGDCGAFDMCTCWRNWQAADCSERTCPFALAHVDTPKGDLNHDNDVDNVQQIEYNAVYYKGTTEQFPAMKDSYGNTLTNTGHYYMECANKGICDRSTGECECFEGYEGTACQRAACPNQCSGHGTCESIRELANHDGENIYELWDRDVTYGCECDPGYYGPDCSLRNCKYGVDPLYYDDEATYRINEWNFETYSTADTVSGTYAVKFYDKFGEEFVTGPIAADATCTAFVNALESLPNTVVPANSVTCTRTDSTGTNTDDLTYGYNILFTKNAGYLKSPVIDAFLDGDRATLTDSTTASNAITTRVYPGPASGEDKDFFYTRCEGVVVTVTDTASIADTGSLGGVATLTGLTSAESTLLKKCLGDSNGATSDNVEIYNWDKGAVSFTDASSNTQYSVGMYPHAIKLVPKTSSQEYEGGLFYLTFFDETDFQLISKLGSFAGSAYSSSDEFYVYTTDATVKMIYQDDASSTTDDGYDADADTPVTAYFTKYSTTIYTSVDASCENKAAQATNSIDIVTCLQKGDSIFLPDGGWGDSKTSGFGDTNRAELTTSYSGHLYKIEKIYVKSISGTTSTTEDRYVIELDKPVVWAGTQKSADASTVGSAQIFKFETSENADGNEATSFEYVSQCSNRGVCNSETAQCECFKGYTNDNCDTQSAFAV